MIEGTTALDLITDFETVQALIVIGLAIMGILAVSGRAYRKSKLTDATLKERIDKVEEHEHARKIEWHNVTHAPQIEGKARRRHNVDDPNHES